MTTEMTEKMGQLRGGFTLLNEGEIADYLGENPEYVEPLLRAQKVVNDYFPRAPLSLLIDPQNAHDYWTFIISIHPSKMDLLEGFRRLEYLYREWGINPVESTIMIGFTPYTIEEEQRRIDAHTT